MSQSSECSNPQTLAMRMLDYENCYRYYIPARTFKILRIDGRAFHTVLKNVQKPHDSNVASAMVACLKAVMKDIGGTARFGYTQSDEASILITESLSINTQPWFGGNIQKIVSVAASQFTATFNSAGVVGTPATFDARLFILPDIAEVVNYFISRQRDGIKNSISQCARSLFSHQEMDKKNTTQLKDMMRNAGKDWDKLPCWQKQGTCLSLIANPKSFLVESSETPIFSENRTFIERCAIPWPETVIKNDIPPTIPGADEPNTE